MPDSRSSSFLKVSSLTYDLPNIQARLCRRDQPQQVGKHWSIQQIQSPSVITLLRLVFDTAALRGQFQDAPRSGCSHKSCWRLRPVFLILPAYEMEI